MQDKSVQSASDFHLPFIAAWALCVVFYFLQYALRSAPGVMVPELTAAFGLSALGVSSLIGLYYYTYSTFAILSGASFDRYGAKFVVPVGLGFLRSAQFFSASATQRRPMPAGCSRAQGQLLPSPEPSILQPMDFLHATSPRLLVSPNASACSAEPPASSRSRH